MASKKKITLSMPTTEVAGEEEPPTKREGEDRPITTLAIGEEDKPKALKTGPGGGNPFGSF